MATLNTKLKKLKNILDTLDQQTPEGKVSLLESFLKNTKTIIGFLEKDNSDQTLDFNDLTLSLATFSKRVSADKDMLNNKKFEDQYKEVQDKYISLYDSLIKLPVNEGLNSDLANKFKSNHAIIDLGAQVGAAANQEEVAQDQDIDLNSIKNSYYLSQLKAYLASHTFIHTRELYKQYQDDKKKNSFLGKVLNGLYYSYQGLITVIEEVVRGVVRLGFSLLKGFFSLVDKLLSLAIKDCDILQKSVEAIGLGVDDALGQQFYVIKHPYEICKQLCSSVTSLINYLETIYKKEESLFGAMKHLAADAGLQIKAAFEYAKKQPYEAIRKLSCLATHITIMVVAAKYMGKAFNSGPKPLPDSSSKVSVLKFGSKVTQPGRVLPPPHPMGNPVVVGGCVGGAANAAIPAVPLISTVAATTSAALVAKDPSSYVERIKFLIETISIFDLTDSDDKIAVTTLRKEIMGLQSQLNKLDSRCNYYLNHLDHKINVLKNGLSILEPEDDDDQQAIAQLSAELDAFEKEKILVIGPQHLSVSINEVAAKNEASFWKKEMAADEPAAVSSASSLSSTMMHPI